MRAVGKKSNCYFDKRDKNLVDPHCDCYWLSEHRLTLTSYDTDLCH